MKEFVAAIDFGTANSGVVWGPASEAICQRFQYVNRKSSEGYAKTRTAFLIKKSRMDEIEKCIDSLVIHGISDSANPDVYYGNDIYNGYSAIKQKKTGNDWVLFDYFKMALHNEASADPKITGSGDVEYRLVHVIGVFLRCLKDATMNSINSSQIRISANEVKWGVTIPTIWDMRAKKLMGDAIRFGLGEDYVAILEPEGAACSFTTMVSPQSIPFSIGKGERYMVIDCGGGTTDIVAQEVGESGMAWEVCRADGKAAAGWDIDERFWRLLAQKMARRTMTGEKAYQLMIEDFRRDRTRFIDWLELERTWHQIKEGRLSADYEDDYRYSFNIPRAFENWLGKVLKDKGGIDREVMDDDGNVVFTQREIRDQVCAPVLDSILRTAEEFAGKCGHLDYVFLAGGLSGLGFLQKRIEKFARTKCKGAAPVFEDRWTGHHEIAGGAIMRGAAILLVYERMIQRISKRNYYFDCGLRVERVAIDEMLPALMSAYRGLGLTDGECRAKEAAFRKKLSCREESDFNVVRDENGGYSVLRYMPICLRDKPAQKFRMDGLVPRCFSGKATDQVSIAFFSSESDLSFVFREESPSITREGEVSVEIPKGQSLSISVDFNEFQQEFFEAEIIRCGKVLKTVKIKPQFKIGY
jgi:hypothetical protein